MKDPAVLFYTQDFLTGTMLMTDEQKGKYITLLCLQHQNGKLSEKDMMKICGEYDAEIWAKFFEKDGYYYNGRMLREAEKRCKFTESRRKNLEGKPHMDAHMATHMDVEMDLHMENENINENKYVYSKFYDDEILRSDNDDNYLRIVKVLFGDNDFGHKLSSVLRMRDQLTYEQAQKIISYKARHGIVISEVLEEMENWNDLKKRTSVYKTFLTFMKNKYPQTKDK